MLGFDFDTILNLFFKIKELIGIIPIVIGLLVGCGICIWHNRGKSS